MEHRGCPASCAAACVPPALAGGSALGVGAAAVAGVVVLEAGAGSLTRVAVVPSWATGLLLLLLPLPGVHCRSSPAAVVHI